MVSRGFSSSSRLVPWLAAAAVCIACGGPEGPTSPSNPAGPAPKVVSVSVQPLFVSLEAGQKATFIAVVVAESGVTERGVTWTSSSPTTASVDKDTGVVTALKKGNAAITASAKADPSFRGAGSVTVFDDEPTTVGPPTVTPISPVPPAEPAPDPEGRKYLGTFGVTANQDAPVNSCFLNGYQGNLALTSKGTLPTGDLDVDFAVTYGTSARGYTGTVNADGSFSATGAGPAGGTSTLTGLVVVSPSGAATIAFSEKFSCPTNGGATFRGGGDRK